MKSLTLLHQADELHGDAGDDLLDGGLGTNSYEGGKGFDQAVYKPGEQTKDVEQTWLTATDILFTDMLGLAEDLR